MDNSTVTESLKGVVPAVCDAEAGQEPRAIVTMSPAVRTDPPSMHHMRSVVAELCIALRSALDDERAAAEDSLRRASELLDDIGGAAASAPEVLRGGLCAWQVRKVTAFIEASLARTIRNEDLAALVRLTPAHFGRAFRNSVGEPPHEYVIRRRIERAQGLMLSTDASLSDIALDCGLADQSHLTRLFRRLVGESPSHWRRARLNAPEPRGSSAGTRPPPCP